jgi:hypothetical protein
MTIDLAHLVYPEAFATSAFLRETMSNPKKLTLYLDVLSPFAYLAFYVVSVSAEFLKIQTSVKSLGFSTFSCSSQFLCN